MSDRLHEGLERLVQHVVWSGSHVDGYKSVGVASLASEHRQLLEAHNGFIAFEGGLRCFGMVDHVLPSITSWNREDGWRSAYRYLSGGLVFFAEDIFGNQFALEEQGIVRFLVETAEREFLADSLDEWLAVIIGDPDEELGLWLLREWQALANNAVGYGEHLCPKVPFFLGGSYDATNLYVQDRNASMVSKGDLAWQTRSAPNGSKARLKVTD